MAIRECLTSFKNDAALAGFESKVKSGVNEFIAARDIIADLNNDLNNEANLVRKALGVSEKGLNVKQSDKPEKLLLKRGDDTDPQSRVTFDKLGIKEGDSTKDIIDKLIGYDGEFTDILKAIKSDPNLDLVKVELSQSRYGGESGEAGLYHPVGHGEGKDGLLQVYNKDNTYYTFTHELMHFYTLDSAVANEVKETDSYKAIEDYYNFLAGKKGKPVPIAGNVTIENYGLTNVKEFMAEMLINPEFRSYVSDTFAANKDEILASSKAVRDSKANGIGEMIANFFRDIFEKVFSKKEYNIPFDQQKSVIDNAVKIATDLFFGGQNVTAGQEATGDGAKVLGMGVQDSKAAALAFPSQVDYRLNEFVKSALDKGASIEDIKGALRDYGFKEGDINDAIESNVPEEDITPKTKEAEDLVISKAISEVINEKNFPTIFENNKTKQQIAAKTQGEGQQREVDGTYVEALEQDLRDVSTQVAATLRSELGADWGSKTLSFLEQNPSKGNIGVVIGLLNVMSTDVFQRIKNTHNSDILGRLYDMQQRIDAVSNQRARDASLGLRQRILYTKFANGENMRDALANTILNPEQEELIDTVKEIISQKVTDEELNKATTKKVKKQSTVTDTKSSDKKISDDTKKDLVLKAERQSVQPDENGKPIKKSFKDFISQANEKIKNIKC